MAVVQQHRAAGEIEVGSASVTCRGRRGAPCSGRGGDVQAEWRRFGVPLKTRWLAEDAADRPCSGRRTRHGSRRDRRRACARRKPAPARARSARRSQAAGSQSLPARHRRARIATRARRTLISTSSDRHLDAPRAVAHGRARRPAATAKPPSGPTAPAVADPRLQQFERMPGGHLARSKEPWNISLESGRSPRRSAANGGTAAGAGALAQLPAASSSNEATESWQRFMASRVPLRQVGHRIVAPG